jgi:hypothetical protein
MTMHVPRTREEALGKIEQELRGEQASALGRMGRKLEKAIEELAALELLLSTLEGDQRKGFVAQHAAVRKDAQTWAWYLEIQREAMGLRNHAAVRELYRIPPAIRG